jgi:aspartyl-tRNA(Asn)/glutamyl-tRNA(Gln) amidotransferase subunit A
MLDVMAGPSDRDMSTLPPPPASFQAAARTTDISDLRIAWSPTLGYATVDSEVAEVTERAARVLGDLGCELERIEHVFDDPGQDWFTLFCAKFAAAHRDDLDRVRDILEPGYLSFVESGMKTSAADSAIAGYGRRRLMQRMGEVLTEFDLLLTPTVAVPPLPIGVDNPETIDGRTISLFGWIPFTYPFNMTGQPAASVPCGFTSDGRPIGLQIVGRRFDEYTVLRASAAYEKAAPWAQRHPPAPFG